MALLLLNMWLNSLFKLSTTSKKIKEKLFEEHFKKKRKRKCYMYIIIIYLISLG